MHLAMDTDRDPASHCPRPRLHSTCPRDLYPCSAHLHRLPDSGDKNRGFHANSHLGHTVVSDAMSPVLQALVGFRSIQASWSPNCSCRQGRALRHHGAGEEGVKPMTRRIREAMQPALSIPMLKTHHVRFSGQLHPTLWAHRPEQIVISTALPTVQPVSLEGFSASFSSGAAPPRYAPRKWCLSTPPPTEKCRPSCLLRSHSAGEHSNDGLKEAAATLTRQAYGRPSLRHARRSFAVSPCRSRLQSVLLSPCYILSLTCSISRSRRSLLPCNPTAETGEDLRAALTRTCTKSCDGAFY